MEDLPEVPFELMLSYLSLRERLRLNAVSRKLYLKIANYRVSRLCYSERSIERIIMGKSRWVSGAFAQNFISSTRFASFFNTFGKTVLSSLKHLRLCDLDLVSQNAFTRNLNSLGQLEELDIIRMKYSSQQKFKLTLPMLTSIRLEELRTDRKLILEAPRLRKLNLMFCPDLRLDIVHGDSVESLITRTTELATLKNLRNLKYLRVVYLPRSYPTLLSSLEQLKEIHLGDCHILSKLFEQKQRDGRADLKIYLCGRLLDGPDDPAINAMQGSLYHLSPEAFVCLTESPSRLADEISLYRSLCYVVIESVAPGLEMGLLNRFTELNRIIVNRPIQDAQRFLDLLKNCKNIVDLWFSFSHRRQDLFDWLPEHCSTVQCLIIGRPPSDLAFLFRLKHLIKLNVNSSFDVKLIRKAFEELPFLSYFRFKYDSKQVTIETSRPKQFKVSITGRTETFSDLNAAIIFCLGRVHKRKADELEMIELN